LPEFKVEKANMGSEASAVASEAAEVIRGPELCRNPLIGGLFSSILRLQHMVLKNT